MKHYNFSFKTTENKKSNVDKMNDDIMKAILNFAPYLKKDNKKNNKKEKCEKIFKEFLNTCPNNKKERTTINGIDILDFANACALLSRTPNPKDTYDFELPDGTPVRIFDDEIQVGYDLIPKSYLFEPTKYYDFFTPKQKKIVIDIALKMAA